MITEINEQKTLTKHISCEFKCKFDEQKVIQINGGITINNKHLYECKTYHVCEKY